MVCTAQLLSFLKSYDFISDEHLEEHSEEESLGNFATYCGRKAFYNLRKCGGNGNVE